MAALKIYGIPRSRAARVLRMARELGIPHENIPVHFAKTRETPELIEINPNARIPAIDDNGFTLYESMAIDLYLARKHGAGSPIAPASIEEEALAAQWSFWAMTEVERPLLTLLHHASKTNEVDDATLAKAKSDLERPMTALERHLSDREWLAADRFTVADLNVASVISWARGGAFEMAAWPKAAAWLGRCLARPAWPSTAEPQIQEPQP